MGLRFFKRKKLVPGLTLNLSRSGPSLSVGPKGAKLTVGPRGSRTTVGIPGSGLYVTAQQGVGSRTRKRRKTLPAPLPSQVQRLDANRGYELFRRGSWQQSANYFERYLAGQPYDLAARHHLAKAYMCLGQIDAAFPQLEWLRVACANDPDATAEMTALLGACWRAKGDIPRAIAMLDSVSLDQPVLSDELQRCLAVRAMLRYTAGRPEEALRDLDHLYAQNPNWPALDEMKAHMRAGLPI